MFKHFQSILVTFLIVCAGCSRADKSMQFKDNPIQLTIESTKLTYEIGEDTALH